MRRNAADILFVYHYTHRPPSSLSSYRPPASLLLVSLAGPSSLSPRLSLVLSLRFSFSCPPLPLLFPPPSPLPPLLPAARICIYFILLLNKPLPVILAAHASLRAYIRDPRQTQSPLDARIGLRDRSRHEKHFFSTLPLFRVSFPLHVCTSVI